MINKKPRRLAIEHNIEEAKYWISYHKRTGGLAWKCWNVGTRFILVRARIRKLELEDEINGWLD